MTTYSQVVQKQRDYFRSGGTVPLSKRKERLKTLRRFIVENTDALCEAVYQDLRRNRTATNMLEIGSTIQEIDYMIDNLDNWAAPTFVDKTFVNALDQPLLVKEPLGVVLIISPWNYPVNMILLPLIPALAAGNTVVIKPSEMSANTAATFEKLIPQYFEPEYLTVINGGVPETTELLKERFDHILYTGCPPVAKIIMTAAAKHLTPVTLELGGKCPVIVENDCDIDTAARRIAWGKWLNCGQTCLAPDYILTTSAVKGKLVDSFRKYITEFYGNDIRNSNDYSRIINQRHFDRLSTLIDSTKGTVLFKGGERDREDNFIPPYILDVERDDPFMHDEIFGPVLPIITVKDLTEAIEYINAGEKPLAAYIFTSNEKKAKRLIDETSSGGVTVNDVIMHLTVDTLPFGGVGTSGMGRYRGKYGFDTFTHEKAVLKRGFFGESLQAARYPPMSQKKLEQLQMLTEVSRTSGMSLVRSTSAVDVNASLISTPESAKKKTVTFNLTRNERHFYEPQKCIEEVIGEELMDKELEMALDSGKVSHEDMMKELLELCGWHEEDEKGQFSMSSTPPSDSGGSFTYDYTSSMEITDCSENSTPTRISRNHSRSASISSLKFDSLRIRTSPYSRPPKLSRLPSNVGSKKLPRHQASWWDDISNGIMREDLSESPEAEKPSSPQKEHDFWNDVEF